MPSAKKQIKGLVQGYYRKYRWEYDLLIKAIEMKRKMIREGVDASEGADMTPMYEMTERLQTAFIMALSPEESQWFKSKEGGRWFIKQFPQFSLQ